MAATASDTLLDALEDWGVDTIFGLPGDGINGLMEAIRTREGVRFVQVRHEEAAAFMACGYAKYTGRLGVCLATSGPGGIHLLNGLYDAKLDGAPVLAITGLPYHDLVSTGTQQDVELDRLFIDVAAYNARVMGPAHVRNVTDLACRTALTRRTVAHLTFPVDMQSMSATKSSSERNVARHSRKAWFHEAGLPAERDLAAAAQVLNAGSRICILAGAGAVHATEALEQVAETLGAPIAKALLGKAAVPDASPLTTGGVGLLGTVASQEALESCDVLLIVGSTFPYVEFYPKPGQARAVQIDLDAARIGLRYPIEVGLVGDSRRTLEALLPRLERKADRSFLGKAQAAMADWRQLMQQRGTRQDKPMKPQVVAYELGRLLPNDAIVSGNSGTNTTWLARQIEAKPGQLYALSGTLASMGSGLPYAIAAALAYPDRPSIAFVGDGAFTMLMGELATCVKYRLPVKVIVLSNHSLGQIKWEQMVFLGNPEFGCDLQPIDFAAFARACGAAGFTIDDPAECGRVLEEALRTPGPVVVNAIVDPHEPPMPPKVTAKAAANLAKSLARGQPHRGRIALTIASDKVRELL